MRRFLQFLVVLPAGVVMVACFGILGLFLLGAVIEVAQGAWKWDWRHDPGGPILGILYALIAVAGVASVLLQWRYPKKPEQNHEQG